MEENITYDARFAARMPKSYLRENSPDNIRLHAIMARQAAAGGVLLYSHPTGHSRVFNVAVCAKDRPGLFARFAGAFTFHGMNILSARAYTLPNRVALDLFTVSLPLSAAMGPYDWEAPRKTIADALAGKLDLARAIEEKRKASPARARSRAGDAPQIRITRDRARRSTRIAIEAHDEPGLLFRLSLCLTRCHVGIREAEIRTEGFRVRDTFLVRGMDGLPITCEDRLSAIRRVLEKELAPVPAEAAPAAPARSGRAGTAAAPHMGVLARARAGLARG